MPDEVRPPVEEHAEVAAAAAADSALSQQQQPPSKDEGKRDKRAREKKLKSLATH